MSCCERRTQRMRFLTDWQKTISFNTRSYSIHEVNNRTNRQHQVTLRDLCVFFFFWLFISISRFLIWCRISRFHLCVYTLILKISTKCEKYWLWLCKIDVYTQITVQITNQIERFHYEAQVWDLRKKLDSVYKEHKRPINSHTLRNVLHCIRRSRFVAHTI